MDVYKSCKGAELPSRVEVNCGHHSRLLAALEHRATLLPDGICLLGTMGSWVFPALQGAGNFFLIV